MSLHDRAEPGGNAPSAADRPASLHAVIVAVDTVRARYGIAQDVLLRHSGITDADLGDPEMLVSHAQEMMVFQNAWIATGDSSIGLLMGGAVPLTAYGVRGHAMMVCPTVGEALHLGFLYPLLGMSYFTVRLKTILDQAVISATGYSYRDDMRIVNTDMCLSSLRTQLCGLLGVKSPKFTRLAVAFPAPAHARAYEEMFGCQVDFGAEENTLSFDAALLDTPLPFAHKLELELAKRACDRCERELEQWMPATIVSRVTQTLRAHPAYTATEVARLLALSPRTLQRKLEAAGVTFSLLLDQVRRELTSKYLDSGHYKLKEISLMVGYTHLSAFLRAQRRWQ